MKIFKVNLNDYWVIVITTGCTAKKIENISIVMSIFGGAIIINIGGKKIELIKIRCHILLYSIYFQYNSKICHFFLNVFLSKN